MIIKQADNKQPQIAALQNLLNNPDVDANKKKRIEQELRNIHAGIRGEAEVAYELKVHYGESTNMIIINDLRIEHCGLVAQIDHLIINRCLDMWVCESKHFSEGVAINEHGEFSAFFGSKPYGVPSPIEQNNRHILILKRLFESGAVKLPTRLGFTIKPALNSLVLVSKGARISRPKAKIDGLDVIIKNDMLFKTINKSIDDSNPLTIAKVIGKDTLESLAREIANLHKPIEMNWHAKFGVDEQYNQTASLISPLQPAVVEALEGGHISNAKTTPEVTENVEESKPKQKLICNNCGVSLFYNVAKFCWFNKKKFGGNIYCIACQKRF